ncbi:hypothetical protein D3C86_1590150 [compost metagenome]
MPTRITCPTGDLELHEMAATVQRDRLHVLSLACAEYNAQRAQAQREAEEDKAL